MNFLKKINIFEKYRKLPFRKKKKIIAYFFMMPWIIGLIIFFLPPVIDTFVSAFFSFSLDRDSFTWAGVDNFRLIFNPVEPLLQIYLDSLIQILYTIPVVLIFSLFIAIILNTKFKGRGIVRTIFFLPLVLGLNIVNVVSANNPVNGMIENDVSTSGSALGLFSISNVVGFIYDSGIPVAFLDPIISSINQIFQIITFVGVQILLFLAALQSINKTLYEVAYMEGANKYEAFWKITFPMVLPAMKIVVVFTIIDAVSRSPIVAYLTSDGMSRYSQGAFAATCLIIVLTTFILVGFSLLVIPKGGYEK